MAKNPKKMDVPSLYQSLRRSLL